MRAHSVGRRWRATTPRARPSSAATTSRSVIHTHAHTHTCTHTHAHTAAARLGESLCALLLGVFHFRFKSAGFLGSSFVSCAMSRTCMIAAMSRVLCRVCYVATCMIAAVWRRHRIATMCQPQCFAEECCAAMFCRPILCRLRARLPASRPARWPARLPARRR